MSKPAAPNLTFLLSHPAHFISLGFGSGLAPKAPGTFGTLVAVPLYMLIADYTMPIELAMITLLFLLGIWTSNLTGKALGASDHGSIVWDEIVAMMLVLTFLPHCYINYTVAFLLFRLFDIWKPFPIRQCDAKIKGGFGVMLDDILAAVYTIISIKAITWIIPHL